MRVTRLQNTKKKKKYIYIYIFIIINKESVTEIRIGIYLKVYECVYHENNLF